MRKRPRRNHAPAFKAMETLTPVQTGKRNHTPLVLVDNPECSYWHIS